MYVDPKGVEGYHAHVYFRTPEERGAALALHEHIGEAFAEVRVGRFHERPVGPHPSPMFQVAMPPEVFARIVPWLMLNRGTLPVLVHPLVGDVLAEHARLPLWLGDQLELDLSVFQESGS